MELTENERKTYEYVRDCLQGEGYPLGTRDMRILRLQIYLYCPPRFEIADGKGLIEKQDNLNRAIRLAGSPTMKVPLVGTVTAGQPITAIQEITDYIDFNPSRHYDEQLFALKVRGDSMINAAILDGDIVIAEQTPWWITAR